MARLDKLLQKYRLSHKLNLIQKLEPIDARAFARLKIAAQKKGRPARYVQKKNPKQGPLENIYIYIYIYIYLHIHIHKSQIGLKVLYISGRANFDLRWNHMSDGSMAITFLNTAPIAKIVSPTRSLNAKSCAI